MLLLLFSRSIASDSVTPWTAARQASLSFTISQSLLRLMSIESAIPSNRLILCFPLLLPPSNFPRIRVFSRELALCIRWPKYWSFSISPFNEYSGVISSRIYWFDLLAFHLYILYIYAFSNKKDQGLLPRNTCECFGSWDQHRAYGNLIQSGLLTGYTWQWIFCFSSVSVPVYITSLGSHTRRSSLGLFVKWGQSHVFPPSHYPFMMELQSPRGWGEVQAKQLGGATDRRGEGSLETQPDVVKVE